MRLVRDADVLVHNFRPGVPRRLGIGYEQLQPDQPAADLLRGHRLRRHAAR
jgi:crotonobetainyl-CoA:carnitine CoA-transferase CaiB-like acyl-CoA transferase